MRGPLMTSPSMAVPPRLGVSPSPHHPGETAPPPVEPPQPRRTGQGKGLLQLLRGDPAVDLPERRRGRLPGGVVLIHDVDVRVPGEPCQEAHDLACLVQHPGHDQVADEHAPDGQAVLGHAQGAHLVVHRADRLARGLRVLGGQQVPAAPLAVPQLEVGHVDVHHPVHEPEAVEAVVGTGVVHDRDPQPSLDGKEQGLEDLGDHVFRGDQVDVVAAFLLEPQHDPRQLGGSNVHALADLARLEVLAVPDRHPLRDVGVVLVRHLEVVDRPLVPQPGDALDRDPESAVPFLRPCRPPGRLRTSGSALKRAPAGPTDPRALATRWAAWRPPFPTPTRACEVVTRRAGTFSTGPHGREATKSEWSGVTTRSGRPRGVMTTISPRYGWQNALATGAILPVRVSTRSPDTGRTIPPPTTTPGGALAKTSSMRRAPRSVKTLVSGWRQN